MIEMEAVMNAVKVKPPLEEKSEALNETPQTIQEVEAEFIEVIPKNILYCVFGRYGEGWDFMGHYNSLEDAKIDAGKFFHKTNGTFIVKVRIPSEQGGDSV